MPALVHERDRRSVSTSVMVAKKVPDVPSPSLPAFLPQADATASEFLAQFSYSHYVDSATFQWTAHPSFRPRRPVADRPAGSAPSVLANPPLDTRNLPLHQLTKNVPDVPSPSLPAFIPQADATASEFLAQFSYSHYEDSATFQWTAHPSFRPRRPVADRPAGSALAALCLDAAVRNLPSVIQTPAVHTPLGGAILPPSPTPSGTSVAAAHETRGGARSPPPSPTPSGTSVAAAPAAHETRGGARSPPPKFPFTP